MQPALKRLTVLVATLLTLTGCASSPKDISNEPSIKELALVGRCLILKRDASLIQLGRPYPRLAIESPFVTLKTENKVGLVKAGTQFRILRIERAPTYFDGMFEELADLAIARIETGDHAGKEVDLWSGGMSLPFALPKGGEMMEPYKECPPRHDTVR